MGLPLRRTWLSIGLAAVLALGAAPSWPQSSPLIVDTPGPVPAGGALPKLGGAPDLLIAGHWQAPFSTHGTDVVLLVDTSESMSRPSGFDLDHDGRVGSEGLAALFNDVRDPDDHWLALAVDVATRLQANLDPVRDRVALASFAGTVPGLEDDPFRAVLHTGLSQERGALVGALAAMKALEPRGRTDLAAGLDIARAHLEARSRAQRRAVVFVLTDGEITAGDSSAKFGGGLVSANEALAHLASDRVQVQVLALRGYGREPDPPLRSYVEARGGRWHVFEGPYDLPRIQELRVDGLVSLNVTNLTTATAARDLWRTPTGRFGALLRVAPGSNRIRVTGVTESGDEHSVVREIQYVPTLPDATPPGDSWLRKQLTSAKWLRLEAERVHAAKRSRTLRQLEIAPELPLTRRTERD